MIVLGVGLLLNIPSMRSEYSLCFRLIPKPTRIRQSSDFLYFKIVLGVKIFYISKIYEEVEEIIILVNFTRVFVSQVTKFFQIDSDCFRRLDL